jgi:glucan phosphorylase
MRQHITSAGEQIDQDWFFDPRSVGLENVYIDDEPLFVKVHLTEVVVWLRCWKKTFANGVVLYLLDSETDQNQLPERSLTQVLYCGTKELQLKQQLLLGIGGVKLLTKLGIHPALYHVQEGRPAFLHWQLIRQLMDTHKIEYESARRLAREQTVYTNHTLVAAGNQSYSMDLLKVLARYYAEKMHISLEELLKQGIETDPTQFSVTRFALNVAHKASGVSQLHSKLSQEQWPEYTWSNITNGVHFPTWQSPRIASSKDSAHALWESHVQEKQDLAHFVQTQTGYTFDPNRFVITWARRLAGYKQMELLFSDIQRLARIVKNTDRPVQILLAGKAHQGDVQGKEQLKKIIGYMQRELSGHALFVPNYNISVAQALVRGSDLWLNTPIHGQEACGTSGMKAVSNGVIQCTVPDGWAAEVDWVGKGWGLTPHFTAENLYDLLENEVIPCFYERSSEGYPEKWIGMMQQTIAMSHQFSTERMLNEYTSNLYN